MWFKMIILIVLFIIVYVILYFRKKKYSRELLYMDIEFASTFSFFIDNKRHEIIITKKEEDGIYYYFLDEKGKPIENEVYFMTEDEFIASEYNINYLGKRPYLLLTEYES
jgi:uncharacterized protein YukJ